MSGASYDYLCYAYPEALLSGDKLPELDAMIERLEGIPGAGDAAADAAQLRATIRAAHADVKAWMDRLTDVFHAVEWRDSCDWGDDQMFAVVHAYRSETPPARHMRQEPS